MRGSDEDHSCVYFRFAPFSAVPGEHNRCRSRPSFTCARLSFKARTPSLLHNHLWLMIAIIVDEDRRSCCDRSCQDAQQSPILRLASLRPIRAKLPFNDGRSCHSAIRNSRRPDRNPAALNCLAVIYVLLEDQQSVANVLLNHSGMV
jgi:hypothetical protein